MIEHNSSRPYLRKTKYHATNIPNLVCVKEINPSLGVPGYDPRELWIRLTPEIRRILGMPKQPIS